MYVEKVTPESCSTISIGVGLGVGTGVGLTVGIGTDVGFCVTTTTTGVGDGSFCLFLPKPSVITTTRAIITHKTAAADSPIISGKEEPESDGVGAGDGAGDGGATLRELSFKGLPQLEQN